MKEFNRIIGYASIKRELEQIADIYVNKEKYDNLGVNPSIGILLHGVPGVGKSLMASALIDAIGIKCFVCRKDKPNGDFVKYIKEVFDNAAKEPHVVDVANFLNTMGADIHGAGTDVIKVTGVKKLHGNATYSIVPDQIESGTFMLAAIASKGDVVIHNCIPKHLECLTAKILEIGGNVEEGDDSIHVWCDTRPSKATIKTLPYPGFPTDLQPQMGVVLSVADGTSIINESIWESRFQYTAELNKMGANITAQGKSAVFEGVDFLSGAPVYASDLRAGAALIIAGIIANGETDLYNLDHIDRGYECIEEKFRKLGANITRVNEE